MPRPWLVRTWEPEATHVFQFQPHGLQFAVPAEVSFRVDGMADAVVYWTSGDAGYHAIGSVHDGGWVSASIDHFSAGYGGARRGGDSDVGADSDTDPPSDSDSDASTPAPTGHDWIDLAIPAGALCGLDAERRLACWADDVWLPDTTFASIFGGRGGFCGIDTQGDLHCPRTDLPDYEAGPFVDVELAGNWGCALPASGPPTCWGYLPRIDPDGDDVDEVWVPPDTPVLDIAGAYWSACWLTPARRIACWGPPWVVPPAGDDFVELDAGRETYCALDAGGELHCWGAQDSSEPLLAPPAGRFVDLTMETATACALRANGDIDCWGG